MNRAQTGKKNAVRKKTIFPAKQMVRLGICGPSLTIPVISEIRMMDGERYIKEVLLMAIKYWNNMLENNWTYQQIIQKR